MLSYVGEAISDEEAERRANDSYLFDLDMKVGSANFITLLKCLSLVFLFVSF